MSKSDKIIFTGLAEIEGSRIWGRAMVPGISRNFNLYTPDQMEISNGLGVPLRLDWEHTEEVIGSVIFTYNKELQELHYEGTVTKQSRMNEIKDGKYQVSIEADCESVEHVCTENQCYNMALGITWEGMGITDRPGVTASTLFHESRLTESVAPHKFHKTCAKCREQKGVDAIASEIIQDQISNLEEQIKIKWELLELYKAILRVTPEDLFIKEQHDFLLFDLQWQVSQLLTLRGDKSKLKKESKEIYDKILGEKGGSLEDFVKRFKEKHFCKCCGDVKVSI